MGIRATTDTPHDREAVDRAVAERERWGDRPDGLQVLVHAEDPVWYVGEGTRALRTSVRNTGATDVTLIRDPSYRLLELEVDGQWYRSTAPARDAERTIAAGFQGGLWPIVLGRGSQEWRTTEGSLLGPLRPGKHTVRARCRTTGKDGAPSVVFSNELVLTVVTAEEFPPASDGLTAALTFDREAGDGGPRADEEPTFRPGTPIPLVVRVQNKSAAAWSAEALSATWTFRVTHLGTGEVLQSLAAYWRGTPKGAKGRVEPGRTASFHVDLQALYPYDSGRSDVRSVWRPGEYSVRVVTPGPHEVNWVVVDASHEAVESAALRFRVVGPTEDDLPRYLRAASVGPLAFV